jgi:hypothetical protein
MSERASCRLCEKRPPRRYCPSLRDEICAPCCGAEREQTIDCPFDCEYLREARQHEKVPPLDPEGLPHREVRLSDQFLHEHEELAVVVGRMLLASVLETTGAVDFDVREALDALVRTYKTLESGLVYETRPTNTIAAQVQDRLQKLLKEFRDALAERTGSHGIRDKELLGVLVFWQRMELRNNNGRRKGRAFIESLFPLLPPREEQPAPSIV